jgi:hypothetical protein
MTREDVLVAAHAVYRSWDGRPESRAAIDATFTALYGHPPGCNAALHAARQQRRRDIAASMPVPATPLEESHD